MGHQSLLRFACATLAFTLTVPSSSSRPPPLVFKSFSFSSSSPPPSSLPPRKKLALDLLSLLGRSRDAARVDQREAGQFRSCLRFLVPFAPPSLPLPSGSRRRDLVSRDEDEEEKMVWWPPQPVMELARIAVDSGGDPAAIQRELDPAVLLVPDVEGLKKDKCQLTSTPYGRRFISEELNSYFAFLFEMIVSRGPSVGFDVSLSRYDLFHGHLFLSAGSGRLGILFHAREYPAYEKNIFPINMGYCQKGSNVCYDDSINLRNILWLAPLPCSTTRAWEAPGVLVVLDAYPEGIIYKGLVPEYVDLVRTIYEDDFGDQTLTT